MPTSDLSLGIAGLSPLPQLAEAPELWCALSAELRRRHFLRSEGLSIEVGLPQLFSGKLLERARAVVSDFNRFYEQVIQAYGDRPDLRGEFPITEGYEAAIQSDRTRVPLPLSRLDCVLCEDGSLRVIEINSVGVCAIFHRVPAFVAREMKRLGLTDDAALLDSTMTEMVEAIRTHYQREARSPKIRPTLGLLIPNELHRGTRILWKWAFEKIGWRFVLGQTTHLTVDGNGIRLRGEPIDVLWSDFLVYFGYQHQRYIQTRFPTKFGDYSKAKEEAPLIVANPTTLSHFHERTVVNISPMKSYLALPKHLLSWIHRPSMPVPEELRSSLQQTVARTYSAADRVTNALSLEEATRRREELLLKPCQYGGAHGVLIGLQTDERAWREKLELIWNDLGWVVQEFYRPARTATGRYVSLGLYNYGGQLGNCAIRLSNDLLISARNSEFVPLVVKDR